MAHKLIRLSVRLPDTALALNAFVNDAIGFQMDSEICLYYSPNCFGTADAISYTTRDNMLRIHDLKTGVTPGSMDQLLIYAALFKLEYTHLAVDKIQLRIYQNSETIEYAPTLGRVDEIANKIIIFDKLLNSLEE